MSRGFITIGTTNHFKAVMYHMYHQQSAIASHLAHYYVVGISLRDFKYYTVGIHWFDWKNLILCNLKQIVFSDPSDKIALL